uniref:Jacalin-type lectin domain-containing protein n=1 Tax=Phytophthora ramorum TaxID=164328 RepID=H3GDX7_PHYRM
MQSRAIAFMCQALVTLALVAHNAVALENGVVLSEVFGGPHGDKYSDMDLISPGQEVHSITIRAGKRINGVGLDITDPDGTKSTFYHGGGGGDSNTLTLGADEYVTGIEVHWGKYYGHTRVKYICFTTSAGNTLSGGTQTANVGNDTAPEGYQLGGFIGYAGNELDSVGAIWTSISSSSSG